MKHRAQVTNHFIDCLRQAKKDRAPFLQINILGAYASALKEEIKEVDGLYIFIFQHSSKLFEIIKRFFYYERQLLLLAQYLALEFSLVSSTRKLDRRNATLCQL